MPIEISIYFGQEKDPERLSRMLTDLISIIKRTEAIVISNSSNSGQFFAISSGIVIHAYGLDEELADRIESELSPIHAEVNWGVGHRQSQNKHYQIDLRWLEPRRLLGMPREIADAIRTDPGHVGCSSCARSIKLDDGVKFCPYRQEPIVKHGRDSALAICAGCREDPEGGSVYHHSYEYCSRCGRRLERRSKYD
jgi:hypothetical protein